MKHKGWLVPIIVFIISLIGLIFYQQRQDITSFADTTNLPPILWSKAPADITKVTISLSGHEVTVSRIDNDWFIDEPFATKGDSLYIYNIISAFVEPKFESVIDSEPTNLSQYGIDESSSTITLYDKDRQDYVLKKGKTLDEKTTYVYAPLSDTVYTMSETAFTNISTDINNWRCKDLFNFNRNDVAHITLHHKGQSYNLLPSHIEDTDLPLSFTSHNLSSNFIDSFISFLETSKIQNFITDEADTKILEAYGFNNPTLKATITSTSGQVTTLIVGNIIKEDNLCYVQLAGTSQIVAMPYLDLSQLQLLSSED